MNKQILLITIFFFSLGSFSYAQNLNRGLVAQYLFNKEVTDQSGNKNDGRVFGGISYGEDRFGNKCGAIQFNGVDAYVVVPHSKSLGSPTKSLTISTWFKLDKMATDLKWLTVCCKSDTQQETAGSPQYRLQATKVTLSLNTAFTENLKKDVNFDTWYHYSMVYDGTHVRAYLNGRQFFEHIHFGKLSANSMPLEIGRDLPGVCEYFAGSLDDLRIYNRALNTREIQAVFQDNSEKNSPKPCSTPVISLPPMVEFTQPNSDFHKTENASQRVIAKAKHVDHKNDVKLTINGEKFRNFKFNRKTQEIEMMIPLEEGRNQINIVVQNQDGEAEDALTIIHEKVEVDLFPPTVTILTPNSSPHKSDNSQQQIKAQIDHITQKREISFFVNGAEVKQFNFNPRTKIFTSEISLNLGSNIFQISASNKDGQDSGIGVVNFAPIQNPPPIVTIQNPADSPSETNQSSQKISATIKHVQNKKNITFKVNGIIFKDFTYDQNSQRFESEIELEKGNNFVEIIAENDMGTDRKNTVLNYRYNALPPVVSITLPMDNPHKTSSSQENIEATVKNITQRSDLIFKVNGIKNNDFIYDNHSKIFNSNVSLEKGNNTFEIIATNQDGRASDSGQIFYEFTSQQEDFGDIGKIEVKEEVVVNSKQIEIICYDHQKEDGDIVSILVNGKTLINKVELKSRSNGAVKKSLVLEPNKEYLLVSRAWNLGKIPPNTVAIELRENKRKISTIILESEIGRSEAIRIVYKDKTIKSK